MKLLNFIFNFSMKNLTLAAILLVLSFSIGTSALARTKQFHNHPDEKILSYDSKIVIKENSNLIITETITVNAQHGAIKRGIYRDFPVYYKTPSGRNVRVGFKILSVFRNGKVEKYHSEKFGNGVRVYIGNKNIKIPKGEHTYKLIFLTNQQIGFFQNHDELYFNAIGHGWNFGIEKAKVQLQFPKLIEPSKLEVTGYTGYQGQEGKDFKIEPNPARNSINFQITRKLKANEGFTFVATIPKGYVKEPSTLEKIKNFLWSNIELFFPISCLLTILSYFTVTWFKVGRDPEPGTIVPLFDSPEELTPQELRYVSNMEFDDKCFASALINMASHGAITLDNQDELKVYLKDKSKATGIGEEKIIEELKLSPGGYLKFSNKSFKRINSAKNALDDALEEKHEGKNFFRNSSHWYIGLAFLVLAWVPMLYLANNSPLPVLLLLTFVFSTFLENLLEKIKLPTTGKIILIILALVLSFFGLNKIFTLNLFPAQFNFYVQIWSLIIIPCFLLFHHFLDLFVAPSKAGRFLMNKIDGYKMYLRTAEKDRFDNMSLNEINPEVYEKHLPYAFALDAEDEWTNALNKSLLEADKPEIYTSPNWYIGNNSSVTSSSSFTETLAGGMVGAIAASSIAPGSSSSGGGGFSGGGGGGGGGGGW